MSYKTNVIKCRSSNVEECTILGGIDTLYFFLDCSRIASEKLYQTLWESVNNGTFSRENYKSLGFSGKKNGFIGGWYSYIGRSSIPLFRVGFKNPDKQKHVKNIFIQLEASGIYSLGFHELLNLIRAEFSNLLGFDVTNSDFLTSRVDLNAFIDGYDFSTIEADMFRHSFKGAESIKSECLEFEEETLESFEYRSRRGIETLYLGSRSSSLYMKIYDKFKELQAKSSDISSMVKRYFLLSHGLKSEHLWNLEFTIKKEVLEQYGVYNVTHLLYMADSIFRDLMDRTVFLGYDLQSISNHRKNKHISRLPPHEIWLKISNSYKFCNYDIDTHRFYKEFKKGSRTWSSDTIMRECRKQKNLGNGYSFAEWTSLYYESQKDI